MRGFATLKLWTSYLVAYHYATTSNDLRLLGVDLVPVSRLKLRLFVAKNAPHLNMEDAVQLGLDPNYKFLEDWDFPLVKPVLPLVHALIRPWCLHS